ncbi:hypothetical protein [Sutterella sp.]|uniref:hypothetical protein n=1 Tax=Sutterella sp. TaxID=1981025 RepID=UPI0026DFF804|nr:hypothetical protein [Sutterella sp.]MDO5532701.1 hypothetical protein [Sutterella sp.]
MQGSFPEYVLSMRNEALVGCPFFRDMSDNAFIPLSERVKTLEDFARTPEDLDEYEEKKLHLIRPMIVGGWAVDKICVGFNRSLIASLILDENSWRGCTTDWLLAHLKHWCIFLSLDGLDPVDGGTPGFGGFFTGLTATEKGLALFVQYAGIDGSMPPDAYFEFDMTPGRTLGDVVDGYAFDHYGYRELKKAAEEHSDGCLTYVAFCAEMESKARKFARICFPMLIAAVGEQYPHHLFGIDTSTDCWVPLAGEIPGRRPERGRDEFMAAMSDPSVLMVIVGGRDKDDLN